MTTKWVAFIVFVWITSAILASIMAQSSIGATEETYLQQLLWPQLVSVQDSTWTAVWNVVTFAPKWFWAFANVMVFTEARSTFLTGPWVYVTWIVLGPLIAATVWGIVAVFFGIFQKTIS